MPPDIHHFESELVCAIRALNETLNHTLEQRKTEHEWTKSHHGFATKEGLEQIRKLIMTLQEAFRDYATKQKDFNTRSGAAIDKVVASVRNIVSDVNALNEKIKQLNESVGEVTPEDLATIGELVSQGEAAVAKGEVLVAAADAADAMTPPVPQVPA